MPVAELKKGALTLAGFLDALRDEGKITEADCATALRSSPAAEHQKWPVGSPPSMKFSG